MWDYVNVCLKFSDLSSAIILNSEVRNNRSISRTYVIIRFGTTEVSQMGFANERNVKMGRAVPDKLL